MQTKDHFKAGTRSLQDAVTPITSMGVHTAAPNMLPGGLNKLGTPSGSSIGADHGPALVQPGQRRY